ncbi:hypothetical protein ACH5RR_036777 [Cinchona calisaya]|uniref:Uncharacterized protein n=1 Tax=Cinchona calisaya TaxID=153742 RepID=A0ABD2Y5H3_9GENT
MATIPHRRKTLVCRLPKFDYPTYKLACAKYEKERASGGGFDGCALCRDDGYDDGPPVPDYMHELKIIIRDDRRVEFTELMKSLLETSLSNESDLGPLASELLSHISYCYSVQCAEALLKGDTGLTVDLNMPFPEDRQRYPLEFVAEKLYPHLTELFLECGAKPNIRGKDGSLPLDLALKELRKRVWWTCEQSVYRLLFNLCGPGMFEPLMTVNFLASYLSPSEWSDVVSRYGEEGKIIELAALFIMKPNGSPGFEEVYLASDGFSSMNKMTLRQHIVNQIVFLTNEEYTLGSNGISRLVECTQKKKVMMAMMLLLEIFNRDGCQIKDIVTSSHCTPVTVVRVADMLQTSGFELTGEDDRLVSNGINHKGGPGKVQAAAKEKNLPSYLQLQVPFDAMADKSDSIESVNQQLLPLHFALEKISSVLGREWTTKESIFKLITLLCLPQMKAALEVIRSLVQNTEKIHDVACYYANEDKLIELTILLMMAREKIMNQMTIHVEDNSTKVVTFRHIINSELAQLIDLAYRLMGRKTKEEKRLRQLCKRRMSSILRTLPLIEIFEKAGLDIEAYRGSALNTGQNELVAKDVARLLADAGLKLKSKDIKVGNLLNSSLETDLEELVYTIQELKNISERSSGSYQKDTDFLQLRGIPIIQKSPYGMPNDIQRFILARYPRESNTLLSSLQPFRAFWTSGASSHPDHEKGPEPKPKEVTAVKLQLKKSEGRKRLILSVAGSTRSERREMVEGKSRKERQVREKLGKRGDEEGKSRKRESGKKEIEEVRDREGDQEDERQGRGRLGCGSSGGKIRCGEWGR